MCDTTHRVDEDLIGIGWWIEPMKGWLFMLIQPILFINVITVCSYHTCITNMLVKLYERQDTLTITKKRELVLQYHMRIIWRKWETIARGRFKSYPNYTTCMKTLGDYC